MFRKLAFAVVLTAITLPAFADTPWLDARERNQRERIAQGVRSGELTRPETRRLVRGEVRFTAMSASRDRTASSRVPSASGCTAMPTA